MSNNNIFMLFYEPSSSSLMEILKEEDFPQTQNLFQSDEDEEETSLGKRKINLVVKTEDEREVKRIAFFSQEQLQEVEVEDIDMMEEDQERYDHIDNELVMEDSVLEEDYVVDFDGFF